jgi:hypothetical protein
MDEVRKPSNSEYVAHNYLRWDSVAIGILSVPIATVYCSQFMKTM